MRSRDGGFQSRILKLEGEVAELTVDTTQGLDDIPSERVRLEVKHLINTLRSNAGLYPSDEVSADLYALRKGIQIRAMRNNR